MQIQIENTIPEKNKIENIIKYALINIPSDDIEDLSNIIITREPYKTQITKGIKIPNDPLYYRNTEPTSQPPPPEVVACIWALKEPSLCFDIFFQPLFLFLIFYVFSDLLLV